MSGSQQYTYYHKSGLVEIAEYGNTARIGFELELQFRRDPETGQFLARFESFPAQVAGGQTIHEAAENLKGVFDSFVDAFLSLNGIDGFKARLREVGFELIANAEAAHADDFEWKSLPLQKYFIPTHDIRLQP